MVLSLASGVNALSVPLDVPADAVSTGEVKKIDNETGRVTIKHGELKNLNMPAMTMMFKVEDKVVRSQLQVGDKITFVANTGSSLTATHITIAK